jgi:hypothetical protein
MNTSSKGEIPEDFRAAARWRIAFKAWLFTSFAFAVVLAAIATILIRWLWASYPTWDLIVRILVASGIAAVPVAVRLFKEYPAGWRWK